MMKKVFVAMMIAVGLLATGAQAATSVPAYSQQDMQVCGTADNFESCIATYHATHKSK